MEARKQHSIITLFLILILCVNLLNVQTVYADGETPTEPPAATEVITEEPAVQSTEPPVGSTPEPVESTPVPEEATPEPAEAEATATPVAEILTQVPETTDVVVLDENGDSLPLASEEAAEITEMFDPMWCPAGVLPGGAGCTTNFSSISALITHLTSNTPANTLYQQNGIIYFAATTGSQTTGASLNLTTNGLGGGDFNTLNDFNLTLQGGWNQQNGANATFTGTTNFGTNAITVGTSGNPWVGNVTLNNFSFNGVTSTESVTVYTTTGDITLNNVNVNQQAGTQNTAILDSDSGDITIDNSIFDGNGSSSNQGLVVTTGGQGTITISDTTISDANNTTGFLGFNTYDGATLSASTVTLTNVTATGNDGDGIVINNATTVTLNNVNASNNGTSFTSDGSGVLINGNQIINVFVNGGTFNDNAEYGIQVGNTNNTTINVQTPPACTGNDDGCSNDTFVIPDSTPPVITKSVTGTMGLNDWYIGDVTVDWTVSDPESSFTMVGCADTVVNADAPDMTLSCSATSAGGTSNDSVTIKVDKTIPVLAYTGPAAGWYNTDVNLTWSCTDQTSGVAASSLVQTLTLEGLNQSGTGTCTDAAGNTASDTQGGFNIDKTAPSLQLPADITAEATSMDGANVMFSVTATDNLLDPIAATCNHASGDLFPLGTTPVNCSATDLAGHTTNGSFNVIVEDTTPPVLNLPANITAFATGPAGVLVNFVVTAQDSVDASVAVQCSHASGTLFPVGANQVTCTATDDDNNSTSGSFFINVQDPAAPILNVPSNMTVEATGPGGATVSFSATASDVVDGSLPVTCTPASGSTFGFGTTKVECQATDSSSNTTESAFNITVQDTTAPVIALHVDIARDSSSTAGVIVSYTSPSTSDAVDGAGMASCSPASGTLFPVGDTEVTCTITDSHGNSASRSFFIRVTLKQPAVNGGVPSTSSPSSSSSGFTIPLTGGELIGLDCNSVLWSAGIKLSFFNLCDHQTTINPLGANDLPADLPTGFSFVMGLDVTVLSGGQALVSLPQGAGIELDFPLHGKPADEFAVLFWDVEKNEWLEVSETLDAKAISQTLGSGDGFYHVLAESLTDLFYQVLSTEKTGLFVLVKK